jgi:hypothetical protein
LYDIDEGKVLIRLYSQEEAGLLEKSRGRNWGQECRKKTEVAWKIHRLSLTTPLIKLKKIQVLKNNKGTPCLTENNIF